MAYYDAVRETLHCDCGHKTYDDFYSDLKDSLDDHDNKVDGTKTIKCDHCNERYTAELELEMEIHVNTNTIVKLESYLYKDKDGNTFDSSVLKNSISGDSVNLNDGRYVCSNKEYFIENEIIISIFNTTIDENQIKLFTL